MTVIDLGRIVSDKNVPKIFLKRDVVQWIECVVWDHEVAGLSPVIPTIDEFLILKLYLYGKDFGF